MVVGSREVAEEIVQDALERTYLRWSKVSRMDRPGAWVRRVVLNRSISHARRNGAERRALDRLRRRPARVAEPPGEPSGQLWEAVRRLPDKQARAVALHYGADLPIAGVAAELGVTESAAKTLLHRARGTLREDAAVRGHAGIEEAVQ
jgi:RNA polymerase sigma-70 factor (ECF subfamily)